MIETVLASIVGALASGALAKLKDVGGKAVLDSYNALKNLIVHKLGGDDTPVKAVEQKPGSPATTEYLAATLGEKRLAKGDADELEQLAQKLLVELGKVKAPETGIDVHHIVAQATATVRKLVTDGRISVSDVSGQDVTIEDLTSKKTSFESQAIVEAEISQIYAERDVNIALGWAAPTNEDVDGLIFDVMKSLIVAANAMSRVTYAAYKRTLDLQAIEDYESNFAAAADNIHANLLRLSTCERNRRLRRVATAAWNLILEFADATDDAISDYRLAKTEHRRTKALKKAAIYVDVEKFRKRLVRAFHLAKNLTRADS